LIVAGYDAANWLCHIQLHAVVGMQSMRAVFDVWPIKGQALNGRLATRFYFMVFAQPSPIGTMKNNSSRRDLKSHLPSTCS